MAQKKDIVEKKAQQEEDTFISDGIIDESLFVPSEIIEHIYLGTQSDAWNDKILKKYGISHIVCCVSASYMHDSDDLKRLLIPMSDTGYSLLYEKTNKAFPFITNALKSNKNNNVLIHCHSAVNRSPTITVAFMMYYKKWNLKQAHKFVESKHKKTCVHDKYMEQLRKYDKELYGEYSTKPGELMTTLKMRDQVIEMLRKNREKQSVTNDNKNDNKDEKDDK